MELQVKKEGIFINCRQKIKKPFFVLILHGARSNSPLKKPNFIKVWDVPTFYPLAKILPIFNFLFFFFFFVPLC
jgi:hypothetical protein